MQVAVEKIRSIRKYMQENRRQDERISVSLGIALDFSSGTREARISDISLNGCFVDSIAHVREGETLSFKLDVSPGQSVKLYGEVAYVYPGIGFGLRFINLTEDEQVILIHIILEHGG